MIKNIRVETKNWELSGQRSWLKESSGRHCLFLFLGAHTGATRRETVLTDRFLPFFSASSQEKKEEGVKVKLMATKKQGLGH